MRRLLAFALLLSACSPDPELLPTPANQIPEAFHGDLAALGGQTALEAPLGATRVGVLVQLTEADAAAPTFEARGIDADGAASPWVPLEVSWREGEQLVARVDIPASTRAELRWDEPAHVRSLTWNALVPQLQVEREPLPDVGANRQYLRADLAALGIGSREDWGARDTRCDTLNESKQRIAIHHTVSNPMMEPAAALRGIQNFHMDTRGWCDVGYHFLVSLDGRVWEGRPIRYLGAHVGGHNTDNIGVSFIGCFHPSGGCESFPPQVPPDEMVQAGADVVAGLAQIYDIAITPDSVKGHRDHSGASTSCPGDHLHARLDDIRANGSVTPPDGYYGARFVQQSFPLASQPFEVAPREQVTGFFELENVGNEPWVPDETFLAPTEPRDADSVLAGPDWPSPTRAATVDAVTAPGETGRFSFTLQAPMAPGDYPQYFSLVQEGVVWFSDPGQGGPPDDQLQLLVTVLDVPPWTPPMPDAGMVDAGPDDGMRPEGGGCSCRAASRGSAPSPAWLLLGLALLLRRRP